VQTDQPSARRIADLISFDIYLRTGMRVAAADIEIKFNPWHDPDDGRFTFAGRGRYFAQGSRPTANSSGGHTRPTSSDRAGAARLSKFDPKNPRNHSVYIVKQGDTLTGIAAQRRGLTVRDLAWLNDLPAEQKLRIGQQIKLPHQQYLDAGKRARDKFLGLSYYLDTHNGDLPTDVANPPPLDEQLLDSSWQKVVKNGYEFPLDDLGRTRRIRGEISLAVTSSRSRRNQAQAGGEDRRRPGDDGGHYIAARFNGPSDSFNHFAQDATFNRGTYRAIEDGWAKNAKLGHRIFVDILPHYDGVSRRPKSLSVVWYVDGKRFEREFPNEKKGK
jgi:LysM repeat protein